MDSFFEAEVEMERKICRDMVCTSRKDEEGRLASDGALRAVAKTLSRHRVGLSR